MPDEIKARIVIEADTSGADEAAAALEKLQGMTGDGSIGDALAQQFKSGEEGAKSLTEALGGTEEALKTNEEAFNANEEAAGSATQAIEEQTQAASDLQSAHEDLQPAIEDTNKSLTSMQETMAKSTPVVSQAAENMAAFQDAMVNPEPFNTVQQYLDETGQSWSDFIASVGPDNANSLVNAQNNIDGIGNSFVEANKSASGFTENIQSAQSAMDEFNQADPWASFNAGAQDASKAVEEVGATTEEASKFSLGGFIESTGSQLFGAEGMFSFAGLMGGLNELAMPMFAIQMIGATVSQVGKAIYDASAIAEGQGAHGFGTFTGAVDSLGYTAQQVGGQFSEAFGQQFMATIGAVNQALGDNAGGLSATGSMLGGALSFAGNLLMGGLGIGLMATGIGIPLGYTMAQAGMEGVANNIAQWTGQPPEFTGQQATPQMEVAAQVQQGWSQVPTQTIKNTADALNNTNLILTEASDPGFLQAQNSLSHAQQYMQYQQNQYNAAHPYNQQSEALQSQNDYNTMQDSYNATHGPTYWSDAQKAASQGNWFGPNGFFSNIGGAFSASGFSDTGIGVGVTPASFGGLGNIGSFFGGIGQWWNDHFGGAGAQGAGGFFGGGCFVAGTPVLLADGSEKPIETLQTGENLLSHNGIDEVVTTVTARLTPPARVVYALTFSDGRTLTTTDSHPLHTPLQGWKAISPESAKRENPDLPISTLQIGDDISTVDGTCTLVSIEEKQVTPIFNITVGEPHTFYANGVLVHNKVTLGGGAQSIGDLSGGFQMPHIDMGSIASNIASQFSGIQLPHLDLGNISSTLAGSFSGIQLPHLDLGNISSGLAGAFSGIQLPHLDLGNIGSTLAGAFSGIQIPHIPDIGGMINGALGGMFSGITLPSIPNIGGMINGALGGMFSGITLPSIPNIGGMINGALGGMFSGITLPSIPNLGGMINGALSGMFSGITLPSIPDLGGMINGALGGIFGGIQMPAAPPIGQMVNGALQGMFTDIHMPAIPPIGQMVNAALQGMFSGISIPAFASGVEGFGGGLAVVGEAGPELVSLPGGSSVYPMSTNMSGGLSPVSLGSGSGGGGPQSISVVVQLDSTALIQALGMPIASSIRVGMGIRGY